MKLFNGILGVLSIFGALFCIFWPEASFLNAGWIIALVLGLWGICSIVTFFIDKSYGDVDKENAGKGLLGLIIGITALVVSILSMFMPVVEGVFMLILLVLFVVFLFVYGISSIVKAIKAKKTIIDQYKNYFSDDDTNKLLISIKEFADTDSIKNVIEEYDETITIGGTTIRLPKTAILKHYIHIHQSPKFSRYNVYLRDNFTCQYCGKKFPASELTFDHVVPRMSGGKTDWLNIVTACKHCNTAKGCKSLDSTRRFKLLSKPHIPTNAELLRNLKSMKGTISRDMQNWEQWLMNI